MSSHKMKYKPPNFATEIYKSKSSIWADFEVLLFFYFLLIFLFIFLTKFIFVRNSCGGGRNRCLTMFAE